MERDLRYALLAAAVFCLLAVAVSSEAGTADILVSLENETVYLREQAFFFCQVQGGYDDLRLRVNKSLTALSYHAVNNLIITTENVTLSSGSPTMVFNITINITATKSRNNTVVECYKKSLGREKASTATLIIKGGPAEPEVEYEISQHQREILLSWPRPFTWSDYPITGYVIECRDSEKTVHSSVVNDTETVSGAVVNQTVELPSHTPDCYSLNCSVTAYNDLDGSCPSNISIHIPLLEVGPSPAVELVKPVLLDDSSPGIAICVKLPVLCVFQSVRYVVVISHGGDTVLEISRQFSYSSGYASQCIEEKVTDKLQEGTEYTVQVFVDAGEIGNLSSSTNTFKTCSAPGRLMTAKSMEFEASGDESSTSSDDTTNGGLILDIAMATVILIIIVILIIFAFIIIGMWRAGRGYRVVRSGRPPGATNKVFDHEAFPLDCEDGKTRSKAEEPYYHTLEASVQKANRPPSEPLYTTPFSEVKTK